MAIFETLTGTWLDHELRSNDATVLFTSTRRNQAVNDGMVEFAELTECLIRQSTVTVSCNTAEYNLLSTAVLGSSDFVRIAAQGVEYHQTDSNGNLSVLAGDDFPRRDVEWLNRYDVGWRQSTTPQDPTSYYLRADGGTYLLGLDRRPDVSTSETVTVLVPYVARPTAMTSTGDEPFTVGGSVRVDLRPYHKALVHYAAHQLEKLRGDDQASDRQLSKFMGYVARFREQARAKGGGVVTFVRSYLSEARRGGPHDSARRDPRSWP
jgi:hypothetical protein